MNPFRKKIVASLLVVTFLAIAGGFCCGSIASASMTSLDTSMHYKMLDGNKTTLDSDVTHNTDTKQCHTNTSGRIVNAETFSSTKNTLKLSTLDIDATDTFFGQVPLSGNVAHIASALPPARSDILFSVIKKE